MTSDLKGAWGDLFAIAFSEPRRVTHYRYWETPGSKYVYTSVKVNHRGKPRYCSAVYRLVKSGPSKGRYRRVDSTVAGHAKKKDAIARAYRMYQEGR